ILFLMMKLGDSRVIETLLQAGANPNVPDPSCGLTVTHDAAREGFVDSVRVLLNYGADVNIADERGNLPLHLAASKGHLEVVRLLIGYTENRGVRNNDGLTAEQLARGNGHTDTATFIQNHQAKHKARVRSEAEKSGEGERKKKKKKNIAISSRLVSFTSKIRL
uniref:Cyclin-dependent kinase inhibitor 2C (p18, inhibits CDK4) n=1 Tax=Maylandia zebra TaxID=106582 RepID=A0A3P9B7E3_9CICH